MHVPTNNLWEEEPMLEQSSKYRFVTCHNHIAAQEGQMKATNVTASEIVEPSAKQLPD